MSSPQPILDYASPLSKGKGPRLASQSLLDVSGDTERVRIVETLAGKGVAIGAIAFAVFTLTVLILVTVTLTIRGQQVMLITIATGEFVTLLAVINNTWRKTIVDADVRELRIEFRQPLLLQRKTYAWPAEQIVSIDTPTFSGGANEVQIARMDFVIRDSPPLRLFDGHAATELLWIARMLRQALHVSA